MKKTYSQPKTRAYTLRLTILQGSNNLQTYRKTSTSTQLSKEFNNNEETEYGFKSCWEREE